MMRRLLVLGMVVGLIGMGGLVRDASAAPTITLLFVKHNGSAIAGTDTVAANIGDTLTMEIFMLNDVPMSSAVYSVRYDVDSDNELDVLSASQWPGVAVAMVTDSFGPLGPLSPTTATFVGSFQGLSTNVNRALPVAAAPYSPGGYNMGTVIWKVNAGVNNDGADILSGVFNMGVDGMADNLFTPLNLTTLFRSATVNFIPEPGTASLLGLGLVGLVLMGRRSRS